MTYLSPLNARHKTRESIYIISEMMYHCFCDSSKQCLVMSQIVTSFCQHYDNMLITTLLKIALLIMILLIMSLLIMTLLISTLLIMTLLIMILIIINSIISEHSSASSPAIQLASFLFAVISKVICE